MSVTRNNTITSTFTAIDFTKMSNPNKDEIIEYWPGTVAPVVTNTGHMLLPYQGLSKSDFEDGDSVYFRYIGAKGTIIATVTSLT